MGLSEQIVRFGRIYALLDSRQALRITPFTVLFGGPDNLKFNMKEPNLQVSKCVCSFV